jgi:hypothetical protein
MLFRATPGAIDMMVEWRDTMASIKGEAQIDDQLTFNQLVGTVWSSGMHKNKFPKFYPIRAGSDDGRVIYDGNGTRRIHPVPAATFCSAHVYHVQQSADPKGCLVLHLTFVEGWPKNPAKYWRLREAGLMAVRPEQFNAKYLSFTPPAPGTIPPERNLPDPAKTRDGKGWTVETAMGWSPRMAAHMHLIDRHIAALRNAIGIAKALGRQLVMPRMLCLCERSESPFALLPKCVLDGASTPVPHVCPLESVYDVARLEKIWQTNYLQVCPGPRRVHYRTVCQILLPLRARQCGPCALPTVACLLNVQLLPWTFLNSSIHRPPPGQAPIVPARDVTTVKWLASDSAVASLAAKDGEVWLHKGLSDVQIKQALGPAVNARVLHLDGAEGVFGGFESYADGQAFKMTIMGHLLGGWSATWCCTTWDKPRGTLKFKRPLELPTGASARGPRVVEDLPKNRECYWMDQTNCNKY